MTSKESDHAEFSRVGGHVALDLLNTVDWRLDPERSIERLSGMPAVLAWCRSMDLTSGREHSRLTVELSRHPRLADRAHHEVLAFREQFYDALMAHSAQATRMATDRYRDSLTRARLRHGDATWAWHDTALTLATPLDRIARAALDVLTDPRLAHLRQCEDEACGWVYVDTSPRRNRRWCVASDCGNRNRARRFYQRHKST